MASPITLLSPPAYEQDPLIMPAPEPSTSTTRGPTDIPDDFKYGVSVSSSDVSIRLDFIRKVYSILFVQLLATVVEAALFMYNPTIKHFVQTSFWALVVAMISTFIFLGLLFWKRHSHPLNMYLLAGFTLTEAYTVGTVVTFYDQVVVLQALIITLGIFFGLTLYTFQSKRDFSGLGPFLYVSLWALILTGLVQLFIPFSRGMDLAIALISALIFSGYIVYDTYMIINRLSPEEYIAASVELYLDVLNLFLSVLRALGDAHE